MPHKRKRMQEEIRYNKLIWRKKQYKEISSELKNLTERSQEEQIGISRKPMNINVRLVLGLQNTMKCLFNRDWKEQKFCSLDSTRSPPLTTAAVWWRSHRSRNPWGHQASSQPHEKREGIPCCLVKSRGPVSMFAWLEGREHLHKYAHMHSDIYYHIQKWCRKYLTSSSLVDQLLNRETNAPSTQTCKHFKTEFYEHFSKVSELNFIYAEMHSNTGHVRARVNRNMRVGCILRIYAVQHDKKFN